MAEEKSENRPRSLIQYERMKMHPMLLRKHPLVATSCFLEDAPPPHFRV